MDRRLILVLSGLLLALFLGRFLTLPIPAPHGRPHPRNFRPAWEVYLTRFQERFFPKVGSPQHAEDIGVTKVLLQEFREALQAYRSDMGSFPFSGKTIPGDDAWEASSLLCLGGEKARNVLFVPDVGSPFSSLGMSPETYRTRWRGPYLKTPPGVSLTDPWGGMLRMRVASGGVWVSSPGPDGTFDQAGTFARNDYLGDDIVLPAGVLHLPGDR